MSGGINMALHITISKLAHMRELMICSGFERGVCSDETKEHPMGSKRWHADIWLELWFGYVLVAIGPGKGLYHKGHRVQSHVPQFHPWIHDVSKAWDATAIVPMKCSHSSKGKECSNFFDGFIWGRGVPGPRHIQCQGLTFYRYRFHKYRRWYKQHLTICRIQGKSSWLLQICTQYQFALVE